MRKRFLAIAVVILALALFLAIQKRASSSDPHPSNSSTQGGQPSKSDNALTSSQVSSKSNGLRNGLVQLSPSPDVIPSENFPEYGTHEPEQLQNFFLPALEAENVTLSEALQLILQSYVDVCTVTKQEPLAFSLDLPEDTEQRIDLNLPSGSLTALLLRTALLFQTHLDRDETKLSFRPFDTSSELPLVNGETNSFRVSPTFGSDIGDLLAPHNDPNTLSPRISIQGILQHGGLTIAKGSSARFIPSSSTLIIKDSPENLNIFANLLEQLTVTPTQFKTETKVFHSSLKPQDFSALQQGSEEMQTLYRQASQQQGVDVFTLPSVISRSQETATVEIIREVALGNEEKPWTGTRISTSNERYGFGQQMAIDFESRPNNGPEGDSHLPPLSANKFENTDVAPNTASLVHSTQAPDGSYLYTISTTRIIDATGQLFDPLAKSTTSP